MHRTLTYNAYHQNVRLYRGDTGNDTYTKLLLHCDGADTTTTFTDSASGGKTVTANGNAQIDTAQSKFGGASALFDGTGDYLSLVDHADWNFGSGTLTIDFWWRAAVDVQQVFVSQYVDANNFWEFYAYRLVADRKLWIDIHSTDELLSFSADFAFVINTWYHIALIRGWGGNANSWAITVNGASIGTATGAITMPDLAASLMIGQMNSGDYLNGWLDEFRISKGIARWTANFAPRTAPYR